eukprot:15367071-Ditylum_brightwellii.AAC.1
MMCSRKLGWTLPMEVYSGNTQDISKFQFHIWEPIWYYKPCKVPGNLWKKTHWIEFAEGTGDEMCYFIKTEGEKTSVPYQEYENEKSNHQPELEELEHGFLNSTNHFVEESLEESLSPPENIGLGETETSDDPPDGASNGLDKSGSGEQETSAPETGEVLVEGNDDFTDTDLDLDKALPPDSQSDPNEGVDNLYNEQNIQENDYKLDVIIDHHFKNGVLILKARYFSESSDVKDVWESPFNTIKIGAPLEVEKYITNNVFETSQQNRFYNTWAQKILKQSARSIKRMRMTVARRSGREQLMAKKNKQKLSRNARNLNIVRETYGINIP